MKFIPLLLAGLCFVSCAKKKTDTILWDYSCVTTLTCHYVGSTTIFYTSATPDTIFNLDTTQVTQYLASPGRYVKDSIVTVNADTSKDYNRTTACTRLY